MIRKILDLIEEKYHYNSNGVFSVTCKKELTKKENESLNWKSSFIYIGSFLLTFISFIFCIYSGSIILSENSTYFNLYMGVSLILYIMLIIEDRDSTLISTKNIAISLSIIFIAIPFLIHLLLIKLSKSITLLKTKITINEIVHDVVINGNMQEFYYVNGKRHRENKSPAVMLINETGTYCHYYHKGIKILSGHYPILEEQKDIYEENLKHAIKKSLSDKITDF